MLPAFTIEAIQSRFRKPLAPVLGFQATWADDGHLVCVVGDRDNPDLRVDLGLLCVETQEWLWKVPMRSSDSFLFGGPSVSRQAGKIVWATANRIEVFSLATGEREPGWAGNDNPLCPIVFTDIAAFGLKPGEATLRRWDLGTNRSRPVPGFDTDPIRWPNLMLSDCGKWGALVEYFPEEPRYCRIRIRLLDPADGTGWERRINNYADDFDVRSRSQELLTAIAPVVQDELRAALAKTTDAHLRTSLGEILAASSGLYKSRDGLRAQRIVQLLEGFAREDAIPILSGYVREQPVSYLAAFARQSLRQMGQTVP